MYQLDIDHDKKRVVATWGAVVTDAALYDYQRNVWRDEAVRGYDELIDFRKLEQVDVTSMGLRAVAASASAYDGERHGKRFAIVVGDALTFGLSRMYETIRESQTGADRDLRVFKDMEEALAWLDQSD